MRTMLGRSFLSPEAAALPASQAVASSAARSRAVMGSVLRGVRRALRWRIPAAPQTRNEIPGREDLIMRPSHCAAIMLLGLLASDRAAAQPRSPEEPLPQGAVLRLGSTALRHARGAEWVACSPDGAHVLSSGADEVTLWEAATGKGRDLARLTDSKPVGLAFSHDGKQFAFDVGNTIVLQETTSDKPLHHLEGHKSPVGQLVFSPDGKTLAGGSENGIVCLWDCTAGKIRHRMQGHTKQVQALAFTP